MKVIDNIAINLPVSFSFLCNKRDLLQKNFKTFLNYSVVKKIYTLAALILLFCFITGCKKDSTGNSGPGMLIKDDASVDPSYGKLIDLAQLGGGNISVWGRSSDEVIAATAQGIFEINLNTQAVTKLTDDIKGFITQKTVDGNAVIFVGEANNDLGYFSVDLSTKAINKVLSITKDDASYMHVNGNDMFVFIGTVTPTGRPCETIWDFWCGTGTTLTNTSFYHYNKATQISTLLPGKGYIFSSRAGTKELLSTQSSKIDNTEFLIFDNNTQSFSDSFFIPVAKNVTPNFYWGNTILYAYREFLSDDIVITDAFTDNELHRFHSTLNLIQTNDFVWSHDGSKLYYSGPCTGTDCSYAIYVWDINNATEKKLVFTNSSAYLTSPFKIKPSDDDSRLIFSVDNKTYIKDL